MALTIKYGGEVTRYSTEVDTRTNRPDGSKPNEIAMHLFGRVRFTIAQMAQYYGLSPATISGYMRAGPLREAYDRGRAETAIALRNKQIMVALAGSERLLTHPMVAGFFAEIDDTVTDLSQLRADADHTWDAELKRRALAVRDQILHEGDREAG